MVATTVTTAAVATTAATTSSTGPESATAFAIVAIALLIVLLVVKELAGASDHPAAQRLSRVTNLATAPLLMTFTLITVAKVVEVFA